MANMEASKGMLVWKDDKWALWQILLGVVIALSVFMFSIFGSIDKFLNWFSVFWIPFLWIPGAWLLYFIIDDYFREPVAVYSKGIEIRKAKPKFNVILFMFAPILLVIQSYLARNEGRLFIPFESILRIENILASGSNSSYWNGLKIITKKVEYFSELRNTRFYAILKQLGFVARLNEEKSSSSELFGINKVAIWFYEKEN